MQNYLLYNAAEGMHSNNECRYALLKLLSVYNLKPPHELSVVVYTANPRLFDDFHPFFPKFETKEPVNGSKSNKTQLMQNFFSSTRGNLIICDTATYPLKPLDTLYLELEKGLLVLYQRDIPHKNGNSNTSKQVQAILSQSQHKIDGLPAKIDDIPVFNSAVAGLNYSRVPVVKYAGELINRLFQQVSHHPFTVNFVLSHAFQKESAIKTANDYFADYFELTEFRKLLHIFFTKNEEESIPNLVKLVHYLDPLIIQQDKAMHNSLPVLKKWWNELTGKGWSIRKYERKIS